MFRTIDSQESACNGNSAELTAPQPIRLKKRPERRYKGLIRLLSIAGVVRSRRFGCTVEEAVRTAAENFGYRYGTRTIQRALKVLDALGIVARHKFEGTTRYLWTGNHPVFTTTADIGMSVRKQAEFQREMTLAARRAAMKGGVSC